MIPGYKAERSDAQQKKDTARESSSNNMLLALEHLLDGQEFAPPGYQPRVLALAIELRAKANQYIRSQSVDSFAEIQMEAIEMQSSQQQLGE
ncbi:MAG: hypothetical protein F6K65_30395 [Moorea sp. SIO3C2]|nr:hypothetical protein [Moorena sp. SIO3C2]